VLGNNNIVSSNAPINININNYNIHILKSDSKEKLIPEKHSSYRTVKKLENLNNFDVVNNLLDSNMSSGLHIININNSNEQKIESSKKKYFLVNNNNSRFIMNRNNVNNSDDAQVDCDSLKKMRKRKKDKVLIEDDYQENEDILPFEGGSPNIFQIKNKKEKNKMKTLIDDQNDSLIDELADFLNNENTKKKKEKTPVETVNNEKFLEDKLNNAVLNNDDELQKFEV